MQEPRFTLAIRDRDTGHRRIHFQKTGGLGEEGRSIVKFLFFQLAVGEANRCTDVVGLQGNAPGLPVQLI